jgi:hypothetical protein
MMGAFFELGPCLINEDGDRTIRNPSSWTTAANMLFVEYASSNFQISKQSPVMAFYLTHIANRLG